MSKIIKHLGKITWTYNEWQKSTAAYDTRRFVPIVHNLIHITEEGEQIRFKHKKIMINEKCAAQIK